MEDLGKSGWETTDFDDASKNADKFSERRARVALLRKMHRARLMCGAQPQQANGSPKEAVPQPWPSQRIPKDPKQNDS